MAQYDASALLMDSARRTNINHYTSLDNGNSNGNHENG